MDDGHPHPIRDTQARFNRSTSDHWDHFAAHRARIEQLLLPELSLTRGGGRLCVLGAGNCNDLDLGRLGARFDEIHLVDLDPAALARAVQRQGMDGHPCVRLHAPVDLTGIAETLDSWQGRHPTDAEVDACIRRAGDPPAPPEPPAPAFGGPFDLVLSPCVLSQITGYARDVLGKRHPRADDLRLAIRRHHLRRMVDLLAPGGVGLLVCDMAAADAPQGFTGSRKAADADLDGVARKLANRRETFSGLTPDAVGQALRSDPTVAPLLADVRFIRPWLWTLGPGRTFLVYALRFRRSRSTVLLSTTTTLRYT